MRKKFIDKIINTKEEALVAIIAVVLIFGAAGYVVAQSVGGYNTFYVKSSSANIRSCKSTSCKIIGALKRNTTLTIQKRSVSALSPWIKVTFKKGSKQYAGYISKTVLAMKTPPKQAIDQDTTPYTPHDISSQSSLSGIFTEDFSGAFPGNKWVYERDGGFDSALPQIDPSQLLMIPCILSGWDHHP